MWMDIGVLTLFAVAIYGFLLMIGVRTRTLTRKTGRRAEDLYDQYGDSPRAQRRYAEQHGGEWTDTESLHQGTTAPPPPPRRS